MIFAWIFSLVSIGCLLAAPEIGVVLAYAANLYGAGMGKLIEVFGARGFVVSDLLLGVSLLLAAVHQRDSRHQSQLPPGPLRRVWVGYVILSVFYLSVGVFTMQSSFDKWFNFARAFVYGSFFFPAYTLLQGKRLSKVLKGLLIFSLFINVSMIFSMTAKVDLRSISPLFHPISYSTRSLGSWGQHLAADGAIQRSMGGGFPSLTLWAINFFLAYSLIGSQQKYRTLSKGGVIVCLAFTAVTFGRAFWAGTVVSMALTLWTLRSKVPVRSWLKEGWVYGAVTAIVLIVFLTAGVKIDKWGIALRERAIQGTDDFSHVEGTFGQRLEHAMNLSNMWKYWWIGVEVMDPQYVNRHGGHLAYKVIFYRMGIIGILWYLWFFRTSFSRLKQILAGTDKPFYQCALIGWKGYFLGLLPWALSTDFIAGRDGIFEMAFFSALIELVGQEVARTNRPSVAPEQAPHPEAPSPEATVVYPR